MNATDLMIGDWVQVSLANKIGQIYRIDMANGIGNEYAALIDGDFDCADLKPIPLTTEILEKNGFKKEIDEDKIHNRYTLTENSTAFSIKYALSVFQWFYPIDIKYVHELQHIMKLCGINKEIVL